MHRSRFAVFASLCAAICLSAIHVFEDATHRAYDFALDFIRLDHADHRTTLDIDRAALDGKTPTMLQRFKAFASRAFEHDRYSAGRFDLGRSTAA